MNVIKEENRKALLISSLFLIVFGGFIGLLGYIQANFSSLFLGASFSALSGVCLGCILGGRIRLAKLLWAIGTPLLLFVSPLFFSVSQPLTIITYGYLYIGGMLFVINSLQYESDKVSMWASAALFFAGLMWYDSLIISKNFSTQDWAVQLDPHYAYFKSVQAFHFLSLLALILIIKVNKTSIERRLSQQIKKLQELNSGIISISQNHLVHSDNLQTSLQEILVFTAHTADVSRISVWELDEGKDHIKGVVCYDALSKQFTVPGLLSRALYPTYFQHLLQEKIIVAEDAIKDTKTKEFTDTYLLPLGIKSMMDAPFFMDGEFKGILCYEEQRGIRKWDEIDQLYAMSISKLISIAYYCQLCHEQFDQLEIKNRDLENKNNALVSINEKVVEINEDMAHHLLSKELGMVELEKFIEKISFKNSHEVRGPLSRILGLTKLYRYDENVHNKKLYVDYIEASATELDIIVREIAKTLRTIQID